MKLCFFVLVISNIGNSHVLFAAKPSKGAASSAAKSDRGKKDKPSKSSTEQPQEPSSAKLHPFGAWLKGRFFKKNEPSPPLPAHPVVLAPSIEQSPLDPSLGPIPASGKKPLTPQKIKVSPSPVPSTEEEQRFLIVQKQNRLFMQLSVGTKVGLKNTLENLVATTQEIIKQKSSLTSSPRRGPNREYLTRQQRFLSYLTKVLDGWNPSFTDKKFERLRTKIIQDLKKIESGQPLSEDPPPPVPPRVLPATHFFPVIRKQSEDEVATQDERELTLEIRQESFNNDSFAEGLTP